jgi:hypothetical protein
MISCFAVLSLRKGDLHTSLQLVFRANVVDSDQKRLLSLGHFRSGSLSIELTVEAFV